MARKNGFGSVSPTRLEASAKDTETSFLVPMDPSAVVEQRKAGTKSVGA